MSQLLQIFQTLQTTLGEVDAKQKRYEQLQMLSAQLQNKETAASALQPVRMGLVFPEPIGMIETPCDNGQAIALHAVTEEANAIVRSYPALFAHIAAAANDAKAHCEHAIQAVAAQQAVVAGAQQAAETPQQPPLQDQAPLPPTLGSPKQLRTTPVTAVQNAQ